MKLLLGLFLLLGTMPARAANFPRICGLIGKTYQEREGKQVKLKVQEVLHDKAQLVTEAKSQICIELLGGHRLIVGPSTRMNLPYIDLESGKIGEIRVEEGRVRLKADAKVPRTFTSDLFRLTFESGDVVVSFSREKARAEMALLGGEARFRGLENEVDVGLKAGEAAAFQGQVIEGEIQYDVLLKGKKVARGELEPKHQLTPAEVDEFNKDFSLIGEKLQIDKEGSVHLAKAEKKKIKKEAQATSSFVCKKPNGNFNQCSYTCEHNPKAAKTCLVNKPGVHCVRERCNANGDWEERFEYSKDRAPCAAKVEIKDCDY